MTGTQLWPAKRAIEGRRRTTHARPSLLRSTNSTFLDSGEPLGAAETPNTTCMPTQNSSNAVQKDCIIHSQVFRYCTIRREYFRPRGLFLWSYSSIKGYQLSCFSYSHHPPVPTNVACSPRINRPTLKQDQQVTEHRNCSNSTKIPTPPWNANTQTRKSIGLLMRFPRPF